MSSYWLLEKKELLDAVIGVVGVFATCREGGRLISRRLELPLLVGFGAVGKFNGPIFKGGNRRGSRCLLL